MRRKFKIGIWGQYGNGRIIADGQAVRTTIITNELIKRYGREKILIIDTNNWKKYPLFFLIRTIKMFLACENIIIAPADNGYKVIAPLYYFLSIFFKRTLYDIVIGGYLPSLLKNKKFYIKCMKKYKALFVQTPNLKLELENVGLYNVHILSNLKRLSERKIEEIQINDSEKVFVCTLSRVTESKGIEDAMKAIRIANNIIKKNVFYLDIYGIVANDYRETFEKLLVKNKDFVEYKGVIQYDKTVETLKNYFALLFPTYYYGEGFAGNIIDCFYAGLPIIATDWNYNSEIIKNEINGMLVKIHHPDDIARALIKLYYDRKLQWNICCNNIIEAKKYSPERVLDILFKFLD